MTLAKIISQKIFSIGKTLTLFSIFPLISTSSAENIFNFLEDNHYQNINQELTFSTAEEASDIRQIIMSDKKREQYWLKGKGPLVSKQFQKSLDIITDSRLSKKNAAQLLYSGMMSYKVRYTLIDNAKQSIVMTALSISVGGGRKGPFKDHSADIFSNKLINAMARGVDLYIIYDGISGTFANTQKFVNKLRDKGAKVIKYNPLFGQKFDLKHIFPLSIINFIYNMTRKSIKQGGEMLKNRWHDKNLIVDGKYAILGGLNIGDRYADGNQFIKTDYPYADFLKSPLIKEVGVEKYFPQSEGWGQVTREGWRDNDILIKGPIVADIQKKILIDFLILKRTMKRKGPFLKWKAVTEDIVSAAHAEYQRRFKNNEKFFPGIINDDKERNDYHSSLTMRHLTQRPYINLEREKYKKLVPYAKKNKLYILAERPQATMTHFYINAINRAQGQILWGGFSLGPQKDIFNALIKAAQRGVKIYLLTNSRQTSRQLDDFGITTYYRNKRIYGPLIKSGIPPAQLAQLQSKMNEDQNRNKAVKYAKSNIRIFEWQRKVYKEDNKLKSGAFHSKTMSIDGVLTFVGSYNMTSSSYTNFAEGGVAIFDKKLNKYHQQMFANDAKYTQEVRIKVKDLFQ